MTNVDRHQVINKYSSDILLTTFLTLSLVFSYKIVLLHTKMLES